MNDSANLATSVPLQSGVRQGKTFAWLAGLLIVCFALPLLDLVRFARSSELFSYILLIPFVSAYLAWSQRDSFNFVSLPKRGFSLAALVLGAGLIAVALLANKEDRLTWLTLSFVVCFYGICFFSLGSQTMHALAFSLGLLLFLVPFPGFVVGAIETFLQYTSAACAQVLFALTGIDCLRNGLVFQLPGMRIEVAPECSGIHSTLVLFITSLVAGHLFLRSGWRQVLLATAVIPLGILRNAIRIVTIGQLCVHVGPHMIDSPIHRRGGPLFFAASLVPLFLLLLLLRRREQKTTPGDLN